MRKIKNYKDFIKETKRLTDKQIKVVESRISEEYSKNFWTLALKSRVFNDDEKKMIKENLIHVEMNLNLINEKYDKEQLDIIIILKTSKNFS